REVLGGTGLRGVARRGVEGRGVVQVDGPVVLEVRVDADALEPFLVVAVDGDAAGDLGDAALVGEAERAVARGVQDAAVGEDGERHRLAHLGFALGERYLLELSLGGGRSVVLRVARVGAGDGRRGAHGQEQAGEQGESGSESGTPRGTRCLQSASVHEVPPGTGWGRTERVRGRAVGVGTGVRRHPGGVCVADTSGTVTAFFRGEQPLDRGGLNFFPVQDKAGCGQAGPGTGRCAGPRPRPADEWARQLLNAASKEALGGSKSYAFRRVSASGAPWRRSMPASSHSTDTGPPYPMERSMRKTSSQGTSPWPAETKSQPRRGSPQGRWEPRRPLRPSRRLRASLQSTW